MAPGNLSMQVHISGALLNLFNGELTKLPETSLSGLSKVRTEGVCAVFHLKDETTLLQSLNEWLVSPWPKAFPPTSLSFLELLANKPESECFLCSDKALDPLTPVRLVTTQPVLANCAPGDAR